MSAIDAYLAELGRALSLRRSARLRLLAEVRAHLRDASEELVASGLAPAEAEKQAVARFGRAADLAASFAAASAAIAARRALCSAFALTVGYACLLAAFATTAPTTVRDIPQGVPSFVFFQVACLSCLAGGIRAWRSRDSASVPPANLRFCAASAAVGVAAVAAGAVAEAALALLRPAGIVVWRDVPALCIVLGGLLLAALPAAWGAAVALGRARAVGGIGEHASASPVVALVDDAAALLAASLRRPVRLTISPRRALWCAAFGAVAAATSAQAVLDDAAHHASGLAGAVATGGLEACAVILSYLLLGRALGIRRRRATA